MEIKSDKVAVSDPTLDRSKMELARELGLAARSKSKSASKNRTPNRPNLYAESVLKKQDDSHI